MRTQYKPDDDQCEEPDLQEHHTLKGFFHYPNDPDILVSKDGKVFNLFTNKFLKTYVGKNNAVRFNYKAQGKGKSNNVQLHRVLARTFIARPLRYSSVPFGRLQVNHIDGVRENNALSNLEWVNGEENVVHSHINGLHSKDTPVLAKNGATGEIIRFHGLRDCAKHLCIHPATLWKRLNKTEHPQRYLTNGFITKYDDGSEWVSYPIHSMLLDDVETNPSIILRQEVYCTDLSSGKLSIFPNISVACRITGHAALKYLSKRLKKNGFQRTDKFLFERPDIFFARHNE